MNKFIKEFENLAIKCLIIACIFTLILGAGFGYINKKYCSNPYKKICAVEFCQTNYDENLKPTTKCICGEYKMVENPCYKKD